MKAVSLYTPRFVTTLQRKQQVISRLSNRLCHIPRTSTGGSVIIRTCTSVAAPESTTDPGGLNQWSVRTTLVHQNLGKRTPDNKVAFNVAYIDTAGDLSEEERCEMPTVLATHGSPGSHKDLVPLVKTLPDLGARVLVVNFPGEFFSKYFLGYRLKDTFNIKIKVYSGKWSLAKTDLECKV